MEQMLMVAGVMGAALTFWRAVVLVRRGMRWVERRADEAIGIMAHLRRESEENGGKTIKDLLRQMLADTGRQADAACELNGKVDTLIEMQKKHMGQQ